MIRRILLYLVVVFFLGCLVVIFDKGQAQSGFVCGDTILQQVDLISSEEVSEGTMYAAIVKVKNIGNVTGKFTTNFLFIDPNSKILDGSTGYHQYTLKPNDEAILTWQHAFGCSNRPKGEYDLNIGTQVDGTANACNYTYYHVVLLNNTLCEGRNP